MTSGRHSATVSATAREPSICLGTGGLREALARGLRGRGVAIAKLAAEALVDRPGEGVCGDDSGDGGQRAEQRRARQRPAEVLASELAGGDRREVPGGEAVPQLGEPELA